MKTYITQLTHTVSIALFALFALAAPQTHAATSLVGLSTDGTIYEIDPTTGTLTQKAREDISDFSLGGIARKQDTLYYVAKPSGVSENAIYTANLALATISHVDLDRSESVRALFLQGNRLFGVLYDGTSGSAGVYRIDPQTGVTTLIVDLAALDVEPLGGAFARVGNFFYILAQPESDSGARKLVRFRLRANSAVMFDVTDALNAPVLCNRIKLNLPRLQFFCLASPSATQVDTYRLRLNGRAKLLSTLANVERVAGGHSLVTSNARTYSALVYAPGDSDAQRLLTLSAAGVVKSTVTINSIIVGLRYGKDEPAANP